MQASAVTRRFSSESIQGFLAQTSLQFSAWNEQLMRLKRSREGSTMTVKAAIGKYGWIRVLDVMTKDPLTVMPSETIGQADELMSENRFRQIPVVKNW
jgi:CBS-domain-containing membrane protein